MHDGMGNVFVLIHEVDYWYEALKGTNIHHNGHMGQTISNGNNV